MKSSSLFNLIYLLILKAIFLAFIITFYLGLSPDEAQYWTWSQNLDWGYYSKPPAIAWQIWATTAFLGNTELGVRFGALIVGSLLSLTIFFLGRRCGLSERGSFWAGVAMAFSPLGFYLSLATTTDGGAILFLLLAILVVAGERPRYLVAGLCILCGALYKWTAFIFWPVILLFLLFFPKMRKWGLVGGILISAMAFLPPLYWNMGHEWATFKHVGGALGTQWGGNFFEFLGAQIGLISPIFFILLVMGYVALWRLSSNRSLLLCATFPLIVLAYLGAALFKKIQPNWAAYLYPSGMVLIAWVAYPRYKKWLHIGTWLSIGLVCFALLMPWVAFRQTLGWEKIAPALTKSGYDPTRDFLMGDKYQTASLLSFYGPGQKRAYFFNISQTRKNQFSYWPQMQELEVTHTGYFVVVEKGDQTWCEKHYVERLSPYFKNVSFVGTYPLYESKKYALIFRCEGYLGLAPRDPDRY